MAGMINGRARTVLVTGSSQGIGLQLVKHYVNQGWNVIATARNPSKSKELQESGAFAIETLDVSNDESISTLSQKLKDQKLDMLINNAGILLRDNFDTFEKSIVVDQFMVNALGPLLVTRAFYPNLKSAAEDYKQDTTGSPLVVNVTSRMGSMEDNTSGMKYGYRASKSALNAITKSMSVDFKKDGICVCLVHPGYVQTNMTAPTATLTPEESVNGITSVISQMDFEKSGLFYHSNGSILPW